MITALHSIAYTVKHPTEAVADWQVDEDDTTLVHGQLLNSEMLGFGARLMQTLERDEKKWRSREFQKTIHSITQNDSRFATLPGPILFFPLSTLLTTIATLRHAWRTPIRGRQELVTHLYARAALLLCLEWDDDMLDVPQYRCHKSAAFVANAALLWDMNAMFRPMMEGPTLPDPSEPGDVDTSKVKQFIEMIVMRMQGDTLPQEYYNEYTKMSLLVGDQKLFRRRRPQEKKPSFAVIVRELRGVVFAHATHAAASRLLRTVPVLEESLVRSCAKYYCRQKNIEWDADSIFWDPKHDKFRVGNELCTSYAHGLSIQNPTFLSHVKKRRREE